MNSAVNYNVPARSGDRREIDPARRRRGEARDLDDHPDAASRFRVSRSRAERDLTPTAPGYVVVSSAAKHTYWRCPVRITVQSDRSPLADAHNPQRSSTFPNVPARQAPFERRGPRKSSKVPNSPLSSPRCVHRRYGFRPASKPKHRKRNIKGCLAVLLFFTGNHCVLNGFRC
jgi:hypothetical protein